MIFLAFCGLSFCGRKTSLSGSLHRGHEQKCPQLLRPTPGLGLCTRGPNSGLLSLVRPTGSKVDGRPMRVNDLLRMELIAECLGKRPAFLVQKRPWRPSSSTTLPQRHLELSRILAPVLRAIAIRHEAHRDWASFQHWQLGTLLTRWQCDSLVQQVTDSGSKGYWCLAGNWVYPYRRGHPRLLVFPFLMVMNHGVWTRCQLHSFISP